MQPWFCRSGSSGDCCTCPCGTEGEGRAPLPWWGCTLPSSPAFHQHLPLHLIYFPSQKVFCHPQRINFSTDRDQEQQSKWLISLTLKQYTFYFASTAEKPGPGFEQKQLYWFGMKRHLKLFWHSSTKGEGQSFQDLKMFSSFLSIAICERELREPLMLMITEELSLLRRFP